MLTVKHTYLSSDLLDRNTHIIHGFSLRNHGDMRDTTRQTEFLKLIGIRNPLFLAKQVHGDSIIMPTDGQSGIIEADGILMQRSNTQDNGFAIGVVTADCVPIILTDSRGSCISVVHAGWKGTMKGIVTKALLRMLSLGVRVEDVMAIIGPRIGGCCYSVPEERARLFQTAFGMDPRVCYSSNGKWYVDIGWVNYSALSERGVLPGHMDALPMCTSCQFTKYFSYRKDTKDTFGEQLTVIAFTP